MHAARFLLQAIASSRTRAAEVIAVMKAVSFVPENFKEMKELLLLYQLLRADHKSCLFCFSGNQCSSRRHCGTDFGTLEERSLTLD